MKKLILMLTFVSLSLSAMSQDDFGFNTPTQKHSVSTNSFGSNWFVQLNLAGTSFKGDQEKALTGLSSGILKDYRTNLGLSLYLGKWFTPGLGLRTKLNGMWGRTVLGDNKSDNASKYWILQEQVLFNLSNMLYGYSDSRVWNLIPYIGGGLGRNMSYNQYALTCGFGLLNTFRLNSKWALNLDLNYNVFSGDFDGATTSLPSSGFSIKGNDRTLALEIGLTYNLGKGTWQKSPDIEAINALSQAQLDALNSQLAASQGENIRLKKMLAEAQNKPAETKVVKEIHVTPVSVFFNLGQSRIASKKDLQNVKELVEVAKVLGSQIVVNGYADSKTGSASYNAKLSEKRANAVVDEIVNMGFDRANIVVKANGGVDELSPMSYNRRATVAIVK